MQVSKLLLCARQALKASRMAIRPQAPRSEGSPQDGVHTPPGIRRRWCCMPLRSTWHGPRTGDAIAQGVGARCDWSDLAGIARTAALFGETCADSDVVLGVSNRSQW